MLNDIKIGILQGKDVIYCRETKTTQFFLDFLLKNKIIAAYQLRPDVKNHYEILLKKSRGESTYKNLTILSKPG